LKKVVVQAKTVEDAVEQALYQLNTTRDKVNVHVLEQPRKGFLGLFRTRETKVEVERIFDPVEEAVRFLTQVVNKMGVKVDLDLQRSIAPSQPVVLNLVGDDLGILIGKRGQTLESLQYLVNIAANREAVEQVRFILDADGYRKRREEALIGLAERLAKQVLRTKKQIVLEPMPPSERKVIHGAIQREKHLTTHSEGIDPNRCVVISWKP
jgi:spoIIIJ-associated protein